MPKELIPLVPIRQAGTSLRERKHDLLFSYLPKVLLAAVVVSFVVPIWVKYLCKIVPAETTLRECLIATALFGGALFYSLSQYFKMQKEAYTYNKGIEGEIYIGTLLERFRSRGAEIYHDIAGEGFNVDHLIVSRKGIYMIETKNWTKKDDDARIHFDGVAITANGYRSEEVLERVAAYEEWLNDLFCRLTSKHWEIQKVVLFPNWYVENSSANDTWVLNEKAFMKWFDNAEERLDEADYKLLVSRLSDHLKLEND